MAGFGPDSSGIWCSDATPGAVARLAATGVDWVCLDAQHGAVRAERADRSGAELSHLPRDAGGSGRLLCTFESIGAALDAGAGAVIVPQVDSVAHAELAVAATYYPPHGRRSWGQLGVAWGIGLRAARRGQRRAPAVR